MADRDEKGRFTRGNKASPGRPHRPVEEDALRKFAGLIVANWEAMCQKIIERALAGDLKAFELAAAYYIGKPADILELRSADVTLLGKVLEAYQQRGHEIAEVLQGMLEEVTQDDSPYIQ